MPTPIVIFAQVPPPEHGQSRMVLLGLVALREMPRDFEVHHVNAKFSNTLEEIGDGSFGIKVKGSPISVSGHPLA